jgi:hypothetical protein
MLSLHVSAHYPCGHRDAISVSGAKQEQAKKPDQPGREPAVVLGRHLDVAILI